MLGAGALGRLRGMVWGGRREEGSGQKAEVQAQENEFTSSGSKGTLVLC